MSDVDPTLPGAELVNAGLAALRCGELTTEALLVAIGAPRLRRLGLPVPPGPVADPEIALYQHLGAEDPRGVHSRYNALIRRLVSCERALERAQSRRARAGDIE